LSGLVFRSGKPASLAGSNSRLPACQLDTAVLSTAGESRKSGADSSIIRRQARCPNHEPAEVAQIRRFYFTPTGFGGQASSFSPRGKLAACPTIASHHRNFNLKENQ
jgi:hypothetical protein